MLDAIGAPELADDARFADNEARVMNRETLVEALSAVFITRTKADWLAVLDGAGVPAGPVLDIAEMHRDPQALARGMITEVTHGRLGSVATLGSPLKFSESRGEITRGAPLLGEHTREVLAEYGYADDQVEALIAEGAVIAA